MYAKIVQIEDNTKQTRLFLLFRWSLFCLEIGGENKICNLFQ